MAKRIYVYLNDIDLSLILEMLSGEGLSFYDKNRTLTFEIGAISSNIATYAIGYNSNYCISFSPCFYTLNHLQCASFFLEDVNNIELLTIFNLIKNYIRKTYMLSKDKSCYIGQNIYLDWLNKKYCFPIMFEYDVFSVENNIKLVFDYVQKYGYMIKPNNVRLRDIDNVDLPTESFVIFQNNKQLFPTIIRKTMIRYEYDSECIFVFYHKRKRCYDFILDRRISLNISSNIKTLFKSIKEIFGEKGQSGDGSMIDISTDNQSNN